MRSPLSALVLIWLAVWCLKVHSVRGAENLDGQLRAVALRCEYTVDPLGIDEKLPQLSWTGESARRAERQTAYQVLVATTPESLARNMGDLWDSGKVLSDESAHVVYAGHPLGSRAPCFWKVRVWTATKNRPRGATPHGGRWGCSRRKIGTRAGPRRRNRPGRNRLQKS